MPLLRSLDLLPGLGHLAVELLVGDDLGDRFAVERALVGELDVIALLRRSGSPA